MGTIADKLAKLNSTKAALKSAINGSGNTVGDVFSEYPAAITSGKSAIAASITSKGVETAADATFQQMADSISQISPGGSDLIYLGLMEESGTTWHKTFTIYADLPDFDFSYILLCYDSGETFRSATLYDKMGAHINGGLVLHIAEVSPRIKIIATSADTAVPLYVYISFIKNYIK